MGVFTKDTLSDVGRYGGKYGNNKLYSVPGKEEDERVKIYCETKGPYKLSDDELRQVLEQVRRDPSLIKKYKLASTGGFPIIEDRTGHSLYIYFSAKTGMFGIGATKYYARPTHPRKENKLKDGK